MKHFNIFGVHWKIWFSKGGQEKPKYWGDCLKRGGGAWTVFRFKGRAWQEGGGGVFEVGLIPNVHYGIILLSSLWRFLGEYINNRIKNTLEAEIPPLQAAYRSSRSATEHVFASKLIIERTITARNESAHLIMLM